MSKKLNQLRPRDKGDAVEVKVYRKWINNNPPDLRPMGYCCMLVDKEVSFSREATLSVNFSYD